jgi:cell division protein ZapA
MEQLGVKILDRDYKLAVKPEEKERLLDAVGVVDEKMRSLRDTGKIVGMERIAVMAALQLAHEMLGNQTSGATGAAPPTSSDLQRKIRRMTADIEAEIKRQERLF